MYWSQQFFEASPLSWLVALQQTLTRISSDSIFFFSLPRKAFVYLAVFCLLLEHKRAIISFLKKRKSFLFSSHSSLPFRRSSGPPGWRLCDCCQKVTHWNARERGIPWPTNGTNIFSNIFPYCSFNASLRATCFLLKVFSFHWFACCSFNATAQMHFSEYFMQDGGVLASHEKLLLVSRVIDFIRLA